MMMGVLSNSRNCFGLLPPNRTPLPPATIIATFMRLAFGVTDARQGGSRFHFSQRAAATFAIHAVFRVFPNAAKDHLAGGGLQDAGNSDVRIFSDQTPRVIDHHHGPVVEIGHALVILLA